MRVSIAFGLTPFYPITALWSPIRAKGLSRTVSLRAGFTFAFVLLPTFLIGIPRWRKPLFPWFSVRNSIDSFPFFFNDLHHIFTYATSWNHYLLKLSLKVGVSLNDFWSETVNDNAFVGIDGVAFSLLYVYMYNLAVGLCCYNVGKRCVWCMVSMHKILLKDKQRHCCRERE